METKDICILEVHDDTMHRNITLEMLENCNHYEVMKFKRTDDAIKIIQEKKECISIVVTDAHPLHPNGIDLLNLIEKEFKLPVISTTPHQNVRDVAVELDRNAKLYFVKSLDLNEFRILWENANTKERSKQASFQSLSVVKEKETGASSGSKSPIHEMIQEDPNGKKTNDEEIDEQNEEDKDDSSKKKKSRVSWNPQMHKKFLEAVQQLGLDMAYPANILEIMNVPGLTRSSIASHLQNYRKILKREQEKMQSTSSISGINSTSLNHFDSRYPKINQVPFHIQNNFSTSFQQGSSSVPISNYMYPGASTNTSNLGQQQFPSANNSLLYSKIPSSTRPINMNIPLSNPYSNHPEKSNHPTNLELRSVVNQESFISPFTYNSPLITTFQTHSSPSANENTQPNCSKNPSYVELGMSGNGELPKSDQTSANLLNDWNGNESLAPFPSMELDDSYEQLFNEGESEDLLHGLRGMTSPDIRFDFDDSVFDDI